ncbi:MAG TPA: cytochrome c [Xanthomonadales bacterium]|nr:cytochrome c [Xanthomonadales bacterium]
MRTLPAWSLAFACLAASAAPPAPPPPIEKPADAIAYRQSVYRMIRWNFVPMAEMTRGKRTWDTSEFARRASRVAWLAQQLEEGYPSGSDHGAITDAKPEVWTNWTDFSSKLADLRRASKALAETATHGDRAAMEAGFAKLGGTCKACHDEYKAD